MNDIRYYRVVNRGFPALRFFGCAGCLVTLFVIGGLIGLLWQGWKALLGF